MKSGANIDEQKQIKVMQLNGMEADEISQRLQIPRDTVVNFMAYDGKLNTADSGMHSLQEGAALADENTELTEANTGLETKVGELAGENADLAKANEDLQAELQAMKDAAKTEKPDKPGKKATGKADS